MSQTAKLTVTVPRSLISFADQIANERKISRSKLFSHCLEEFAEKHKAAIMEEGYKVVGKDLLQFARTASAIEHEVIPQW